MSTDVTNPLENKYLYNGKELQTELGLDWYDYGARMYDASLGWWHVIDSLAEEYFAFSPYSYGVNNSILNNDIDGLFPIPYWIRRQIYNETGFNLDRQDDKYQISEYGKGVAREMKNEIIETAEFASTNPLMMLFTAMTFAPFAYGEVSLINLSTFEKSIIDLYRMGKLGHNEFIKLVVKYPKLQQPKKSKRKMRRKMIKNAL